MTEKEKGAAGLFYNPNYDPELTRTFERYYSIRKENYPVDEAYYLPRSMKIETETTL